MYLGDPQKYRAYIWEDRFFDNVNHLSRENIREIFDYLVSSFSVKESELQFHDERYYSFHQSGKIVLCKDHFRLNIVLHEFAHLLVWDKITEDLDMDVESHGPEWLTFYVVLINWYMKIPMLSLITAMQKSKLRLYKDIAINNSRI